jgi:hypothetical protein
MGFGDFGSNRSVHWQIKYDNKSKFPDHVDVDDSIKHPGDKLKTCAPIGKLMGHTGAFRVTARYGSHQRALAALEKALDVLKRSKSPNVLLDVELRPFAHVRGGPGKRERWEVSVDW